MSTQTHSHLTVAQKLEILQDLDDGKSERQCADKFNVGKGTINRLKRSRSSIEALATDSGCDLKKRKNCIIRPKYFEIEDVIVKFLNLARERGMAVTGPMLRSLAEREAEKKGITDFQASEGWLGKVKARNGIVGKCLSGEAGGFSKAVVRNWKEELPSIIAAYNPSDIYNCDETALFYKQTTTKSLIQVGDHGHGEKRSKSRVSLLLCASWMGEKEKVLLIATSKNPRALKGVDKSKLPVTYHSQKKAWMTTSIFKSWITNFDRSMRKQRRHVLLFMDNAGVHNVDTAELSNVKLIFFPKNTTSCLQPLDAGVIQSFKLNYRNYVNNHVLNMLTNVNTAHSNPFKSINISLVIIWIFRSWNAVGMRTISRCFLNCGFRTCTSEEQPSIEAADLQSVDTISTEETDITMDEMKDKHIFPTETTPEELLDEVSRASEESEPCDNPIDISEDDEDDVAQSSDIPNPTTKEALAAVNVLQRYALQHGDEGVISGNFDLQWYHGVLASRNVQEQVQTQITDFFKKQHS